MAFGTFVVIWYVFPVLVCFTEKNLATLVSVSPSLIQMPPLCDQGDRIQGEFSTIVTLFSLGSFFEVLQTFCFTFFPLKSYALTLLGLHFGQFGQFLKFYRSSTTFCYTFFPLKSYALLFLGLHFGRFFSQSLGHSVCDLLGPRTLCPPCQDEGTEGSFLNGFLSPQEKFTPSCSWHLGSRIRIGSKFVPSHLLKLQYWQ
jgi:hypothetical protein